ncbi:SusD family protein [compost metagenome]
MTYAEAQNEVSGPDATVYDALDQIRVRAGMAKVDRTIYATKAKLRELIRNERAIELVLEGSRYYDIRRWKTAPDVMKNIYSISNGLAQERVWTERLYLMPVPQSEMDLSYGVLTQNKGY